MFEDRPETLELKTTVKYSSMTNESLFFFIMLHSLITLLKINLHALRVNRQLQHKKANVVS
jgi:hypothetical protein